jgi:hypothetical protein
MAKQETAQAPRAKCACGCGETPRGKKSKFAQGHDAKLRHDLIEKYRAATTDSAKDAIAKQLFEHNWEAPSERKPRAKSAKKSTAKKSTAKKSSKRNTKRKAA